MVGSVRASALGALSLLAMALAGCTGDGTETADDSGRAVSTGRDSGTATTPTSDDNATPEHPPISPPPPKPPDYEYEETDDMSGPVAKEWTWDVLQVPVEVAVVFRFASYTNPGVGAAQDFGAALTDAEGTVYALCGPSPAAFAVNTDTTSCAATWGHDVNLPVKVGPWKVEFDAGLCVCTYTLEISAKY